MRCFYYRVIHLHRCAFIQFVPILRCSGKTRKRKHATKFSVHVTNFFYPGEMTTPGLLLAVASSSTNIVRWGLSDSISQINRISKQFSGGRISNTSHMWEARSYCLLCAIREVESPRVFCEGISLVLKNTNFWLGAKSPEFRNRIQDSGNSDEIIHRAYDSKNDANQKWRTNS